MVALQELNRSISNPVKGINSVEVIDAIIIDY
jgi:hypothetical protein